MHQIVVEGPTIQPQSDALNWIIVEEKCLQPQSDAVHHIVVERTLPPQSEWTPFNENPMQCIRFSLKGITLQPQSNVVHRIVAEDRSLHPQYNLKKEISFDNSYPKKIILKESLWNLKNGVRKPT